MTGKRAKPDVVAFNRHVEDNLFVIQEQLRDGTYTHDPYKAFVVHDPKRRQIHKSTVKDRVVHQGLMSVIEPLFERRFIFDSYSSRAGKGTHAAVRRLQEFLRWSSRDGHQRVWAVKCDISRFFASVDHARLFGLLEPVVRDVRVLRLCDAIIGSFSSQPGKGIPLGNVTSQLFANAYLNELDQFVKHRLRCRKYVRYCDDFVFVDPDRSTLEHYVEEVTWFVLRELDLTLHPRKTIFRTYQRGVDFLGYVILPFGIVPRTKTLRRLGNRITAANRASYFGYLSHAKSFDARSKLKNRLWMFDDRHI